MYTFFEKLLSVMYIKGFCALFYNLVDVYYIILVSSV